MGLDMYLYRNTYSKIINYETNQRGPIGTISIQDWNGDTITIDLGNVESFKERVGYWRKANAIHNWFVQNTQDGRDECQESSVSREELEELLSLVNQVLATVTEDGPEINYLELQDDRTLKDITRQGKGVDTSIANELLPTASGFFFGGTEYDETYVDDLESTRDIITQVLAESHPYQDFSYRASW